VVLLPSFAYSLSYTSSHPSQAYFATGTRMWELAVGGAVALTPQLWRRLAPRPAAAIGWLGIAGIAYSAVEYSGATYFPGYAAALPVLGAAAVILAGPAAGPLGPVAMLGRAPMVLLGDISYSLYLWHWPIIVFVTAQFTGSLPLWAGLLAVIGSLLPAYLSFRFIEGPGMRSRRFGSVGAGLRLGFVTTMASVVAAMLLLVFIPQQNLANVSVDDAGVATDIQGRTVKIGAEVLGAHPLGDPAGAPVDHFTSITPNPLTARTEDLPADGRCSRPTTADDDVPCFFGAADSHVQLDLVGDSHAMQWEPAFAAAGAAQGWRVVTHTKAGCPFTAAAMAVDGRASPTCGVWNKAALEAIIAEHPQVVVATEEGGYRMMKGARALAGEENIREIVRGYRQAWTALVAAGIHVVAVAETPRPSIDIPSCVTEHLNHLSVCARPRTEIIQSDTPERIAARETPGVSYVDLNDVVCPTTRCAAVIGGVMVYRDDNHLSATYVRTTAGFVAARFAQFLRSA
jgi:hypothetical protein